MERPNGTETYGYGLIDVETASMVGSYETEEAALRDVADDARRYGPDAPELLSLALYREGPPGESGAIASGAELVKRALAFSEAKSESATVGASSHREPKAQVGDYTFLGGRST
ncbi:MAG: hypothetical protein ACRDJN_11010, partial [Chloroflexota bacterium]